jgi:hypothetical protein
MRAAFATVTAVLGITLASAVGAATLGAAIIVQDQAALRAAPRDSAQQQAVLWQGELVEVRGERLDYLQVYDYKRERGGFVRTSQVRRTLLSPAEAPELLSIVRFLRETSGAEALGIGFAAAFIQAAPAEMINNEAGIEAMDALGTFADRLARRASASVTRTKAAEAALSAHLEVAARYGIVLANHEREGRIHLCYDGDAFRRVLAMPAKPEQRARAALGLTRPECVEGESTPLARNRGDESRAEALDRVDVTALPGYLKNRVLMRRASVWSSLAYQRARVRNAVDAPANSGEAAATAAARSIAELAGVAKTELTDDDLPVYADAAMRVSASRWAAAPASAASNVRSPYVIAEPGQPGETCVSLIDAKNGAPRPLARRCTYSVVWSNSATLNREGTALAIAVQPMEAWRELWVFLKEADGWTIRVLPPAASNPGVGYAEFAGWVPGGRQMLVAREAAGEGKYKRNFELTRLDTLAIERQSGDPAVLGAFQRWQDPAWKRQTLSLR